MMTRSARASKANSRICSSAFPLLETPGQERTKARSAVCFAAMAGRVYTTIEDGIGFIIFDHEARRNAITGEMWDAIPAAVEALEKSDAVRVVVMRGAGDVAFVSGAVTCRMAIRFA